MKSVGTMRTGVSGASTSKSKNTMKAGLAVETMSAPNPFCPNTKVGPFYLFQSLFLKMVVVILLG